MCWFPPSHHLQVDRAIQYQAEGQDSLRWAFMCDYNKSNRKQVKETGLTRNQNWLLSATLAVVKLPGPCRMILLKEKVINYASHGSACLCQWSYRQSGRIRLFTFLSHDNSIPLSPPSTPPSPVSSLDFLILLMISLSSQLPCLKHLSSFSTLFIIQSIAQSYKFNFTLLSLI